MGCNRVDPLMKQALVSKGRVYPGSVPAPGASPGCALVKVAYSCISPGTETSVLRASGASLIKRAIEQPERVKKALQIMVSRGLSETFAKVSGDGSREQPTGYSVAGVVLESGEGVHDLKSGDRVAAAGAGLANHAEIVNVPRNLIARVPAELDLASASTVALGAIALQGVRRAGLQLGEIVVVFGTGLLGLITVQLVRAAGCRCIAVDVNPRRLELAGQLGAEFTVNPLHHEDPIKPVFHLTGGNGADAVIFTAATTDPTALSQALAMTRRKGRLVMVGVYGKELHREDIYQREIDFLISSSYGPGRYDPQYELEGRDYPFAFVRWTENRNMEEFLRLLVSHAVDVQPLVDVSYPIEQVSAAFARLDEPDRPLAILLSYGDSFPTGVSLAEGRKVVSRAPAPRLTDGRIRVGIIGAGAFARGVHLPNLKRLRDRYELVAICNRTGLGAQSAASKFGAMLATTDPGEILEDPSVDLVMICTRHDLHGKLVLQSLRAGKNTFVEKPLCTTSEDLQAIRHFFEAPDSSVRESPPMLMVGFNRRFSRYVREAKRHLAGRINPLVIHYRMNAGYVPPDHWLHGVEGGGRIIGEACHIVDLFSYLVDAPVRSVTSSSLDPSTSSVLADDNRVILLSYEDGSIAVLEYFAIGSKVFPKE